MPIFVLLLNIVNCSFCSLLFCFFSSFLFFLFNPHSIYFVHLEYLPWPYVIRSPILSCTLSHLPLQQHHGFLLPFLTSLVVLKHAKKRNLRSKKSIFISFFVPLFLLTRIFPDHLRISKIFFQY